MFIRIRHGINEEMVVNPACFVVSFFRYIRRNIDVDAVDFDAVALCSEEPIVCVEKRLELATESGLVQGLDDLTLKYVVLSWELDLGTVYLFNCHGLGKVSSLTVGWMGCIVCDYFFLK